mgnify:CR=1 FL=1
MAGHSKWANIKHRKGAQDAKRGKIFTKLIREITIAAKLGGPDPDANPRLRAAIDKALSANMTKDTIQRAAKRGAGSGEAENMAEVRYEGYGPNGVAVIVDCLTDNKNRTVSDVRHAFTKNGGNLGTDGSVAYLFSKKGLISFSSDTDEEKIIEVAIEAGAEDVIANDDHTIDVVTTAEDFMTVKEALKAAGLTVEGSEVTMIPSTEVEIVDEEEAAKMVRLSDMLEDLDDVQNVYSNATIPEQLLENL